MSQIARACGVDSGSVCRALRGASGVSPDRVKLIRATAESLGFEPNRTSHIDQGLDRLRSIQHPGQIFTCPEIADACGCTYQAIQNIECNALKRLRQKIRGPLAEELLSLLRERMSQ